MFRVGQKVVCVDARPYKSYREFRAEERPVVGEVYTVIRSFIDDDGDNVLHLAEIARSEISRAQWGDDAGYGAHRFRPIVERKTDIGFAHEILRKATKPAPVRTAFQDAE